jgi:hypothetical protein
MTTSGFLYLAESRQLRINAVLNQLLLNCLSLFLQYTFQTVEAGDQSMLIQTLFKVAPNRKIENIEIRVVGWYTSVANEARHPLLQKWLDSRCSITSGLILIEHHRFCCYVIREILEYQNQAFVFVGVLIRAGAGRTLTVNRDRPPRKKAPKNIT